MKYVPRLLIASTILVAAALPAGAVRAPKTAGPEWEVGPGLAPVRVARSVTWQTPPAAQAAWARFTADYGTQWHAYFDADTGVAGRVFGEGIAIPGSVASPDVAEQAARAFLATHGDLVAPGASPSDFTLAANVESGGIRSVGFFQYAHGLRVLGGQVSFVFLKDRLFVIGSEAFPDVAANTVALPISDAAAQLLARGWLLGDVAAHAAAGAVDGPFILPLVRGKQGVEYRTVVRVVVDATQPIGRWDVYLDAATGAEVARHQTLRFASGTVNLNAGVRWWGAARMDYPAHTLNVTADGAAAVTDATGNVTWPSAAASTLATTVSGTYVNIQTQTGPLVAGSFSLPPGGSVSWDLSTDEHSDAQLMAYTHANIVKDHAKVIAPDMTYLDGLLQVTVNINDVCNAFSDGDAINFFNSDAMCANTGRIADVVYHEFGHSFHAHAFIPGVGDNSDGALGEGQADYMAISIVGDHGMGRGFFFDDSPLRDCDPPGNSPHWPEDVGEIHTTGIIFSASMWDLRTALIADMGMAAGTAYLDHLYYEILKRSTDIPSTYVSALIGDDDDGNLANGTPHDCEINAAFDMHGLAMAGAAVGQGISPPTLTKRHVDVSVIGAPSTSCPGKNLTGVTLAWNLRDTPSTSGTVMRSPSGTAAYAGDIPPVPDGSVVNYQVIANYMDGSQVAYPQNPADPKYETFIGDVTPIYCTDFEGAAEPTGWTHGLTSGTPGAGADDWQWGAPQGTAGSGDPAAAYSGMNVYGNDLGGGMFDGLYQNSKTNFLQSPDVDVSAFTHIRLQYRRWLNVEDGIFDHATIYANGTQAWQNFNSMNMNGGTNHTDREWRFQDVDVDPYVMNGKVNVKYEIASDQGAQFGGWNVDDFCIVAYVPAVCGDGTVEGAEECDDHNTVSGDGCSSACLVESAPDAGPTHGGADGGGNPDTGDKSGGCGCHAGGGRGASGVAGGSAALAFLALLSGARRRRRHE